MRGLRPVVLGLLCMALTAFASAQNQNLIVTVDANGIVHVPKAAFDLSQAQGQVQAVDAQGNPVVFDASQFRGETPTDYLFPLAGQAAPQAAAEPASAEPEIGIAEAAGTLTDPTTFIYLSKEFVFNLLVLANYLGVPGVQFNPDALTRGRSSARVRMRTGEGGMETVWLTGSTAGGRSTLSAARYMAGLEEEAMAAAREEVDRSRWLDAVAVTGNEDLAKILELVEDLPDWRRVGRFPLLTTEKQSIDKTIAGIYAWAFRMAVPQAGQQYQYQYGAQQYQPYNPYAPTGPPGTYAVQPAGMQPGISADEYAGGVGAPMAPGAVATATQQQQGPPPIDPQAMGEWYYYYQQVLAWERYVRQEVLMLSDTELENRYDLDTAMTQQDLYLAPQGPNMPPPLIHFDNEQDPIVEFISAVLPSRIGSALDHMHRVMEDKAQEKAKEDSDRSREFVARLNARKERRFRYREWLSDRTTEIRKLAADYRKRLAGEQFEIDGVVFLVTDKPVEHIPLGAVNIVTERLTPYDLLDEQGRLKKPAEEIVQQTP